MYVYAISYSRFFTLSSFMKNPKPLLLINLGTSSYLNSIAMNIQDYFLTATYYTWSQSLNILEYKLAIREFSCLCICMHITTALILDKIFKDSCTILPIPYFFLYKRDINLWFCFSHHP